MNDRQPSELKIVTSLNKGIELYPLTKWDSDREPNEFLRGFNIEFKKPQPHQTTFVEKGFVPRNDWFFLFDDAEKEILEDQYAFYGIGYRTTVKLARRRVERILTKLEESIVGEKPNHQSNKKEDIEIRSIFYRRDYLKEVKEALEHFQEDDEITLEFIFTEWPSVDESRRKEYVKEFEEKLLGKSGQNDDVPFKA